MAIVTVYFLNTAATTPNWFGKVQDGGSAPAGALSPFGWTVAKVALTTPYWRGRLGATARSTAAQAASYVDTATRPVQGTGSGATTAGDSFRSDGPLTGTFAAGNWAFTFGMRSGAASNAGRVRFNVWACDTEDGLSGSQRKLNSSTLVGTTVTFASTTVTYNSTVTWAAPQVVLNNEYLFVQIEWNSTTVGTSNSCTAQFYQSSFTTPNWFYSLSASNLVAPAPDLDTPDLVHVVPIDDLDSSSLVSPAPVLASATLNQKHALDPNDFVTPAPVLATPTLTETLSGDILTSAPFTAPAPVLQAATLNQKHVLVSVAYTSPAPVLATSTITQKHVVASIGYTAPGPVLGTSTFNQRYVITSADYTAPAPVLAAASITAQTHVMVGSSLTTVAPIFVAPTLIIASPLTVGDWVLDRGLAALDTGADKIFICTAKPTTYLEASSTYALGVKNFGAGLVFNAPGAGAPKGRVVTSNPVSGGTVTVSGTPQVWAVVDSANSRLLATGPATGFTPVALSWSWTLGQIPIHMDG